MGLGAALTVPRSLLPSSLRCRRAISQGFGHPGVHKWSLFSYSHHWRLSINSSLKLPTTEHFGEPNKLTTYLHMLSKTLWGSLPEPVKEFPWKKAEDLVLDRLLHLGKKSLTWFLVAFLCINLVSDVIFSFSRNMELMIPLGLFIGIIVADFLAETSKELLQSTTKDLNFGKQLIGIATLFACIKVVTPYIALPGRMILSHISNGGLMQALWLAKELQSMEGEKDGESPSSERGICTNCSPGEKQTDF